MVFAEADEVEPDLVGERPLRDDIAQDLRVRQRPAVAVDGDVSERIETQFDGVCHQIFSADRKRQLPLCGFRLTTHGSSAGLQACRVAIAQV